MKKLIMSLALVLGAASFSFAQDKVAEVENPNAPVLTFEKMEHDFGTIQKGGDGTYEFKFTNTGKEPLIIQNAKGSCGCTVPTPPKEPIAPGASSTIKVKYDTNRIGPFSKSVTITSNAKKKIEVIRIKGKVEAPAADPTTPVKKPAKGSPVEKK